MGFSGVASMGSNRTFMELKWTDGSDRSTRLDRSNRTFMELKFNGEVIRFYCDTVLIVPLWN